MGGTGYTDPPFVISCTEQSWPQKGLSSYAGEPPQARTCGAE